MISATAIFFTFHIHVVFFNIFINIVQTFEYLIKALESLKCFKPVLSRLLIKNWYFASYGPLAYKKNWSVSGCWPIRLYNEFVFPDPEPPIINILCRWSGIFGQLGLYCFVFYFVTSSEFNHFVLFYYVTFNLFFFTY